MDLNLHFATYRQGLATRQHLLRNGWNDDDISEAIKAKTIVRRRRGVYARRPRPERAEFLLTDGCLDTAYLEEVREVMLGSSKNASVAGRTMCLLYSWDLLVEPTGDKI